MTHRIDAIRSLISEHEADAALITFLPDILWAVGFSGSNGILIVRPDSAHFVTDGRYTFQARREVSGAEVHAPGYRLYEYVQEQNLLNGSRRVIFQSDHTSVADSLDLKEKFDSVDWVPVKELLAGVVGRKTEDEIEGIRAAQRITEQVFDDLLGLIRPGVSEQDIAAEIVYQHLKRGAERPSFDPIVAAGPNSALPHARPSSRTIKRGEMVLMDFGCYYKSYASDMTRMVAVGDPGEEARKVYDIVLKGQQAAVDAARAGMISKDLDAVARDIITEAGYGDEFSHSLGHGLGLQVHEWPRASYLFDYELPENAVITIEPGVYLEGKFGVRIEDIIVLRKDGRDVITRAPKDLIIL